jgi:hypothetical protein
MTVPKKRGPKPKINEKVLRDIELAVGWGWSLASACEYAQIAQGTFYDYQRRNPEFQSKLDLIRKRPKLAAKRNVALGLEAGDVPLSKWYLERRTTEFNPRVAVDMTAPQGVDGADVVDRLQRLIALSRQRGEAGAAGAAG